MGISIRAFRSDRRGFPMWYKPSDVTLVIGLTGGIASGKSAAAGFFRELGVPVIDADVLAHEVMAPNGAAHAELVKVFGPRVLGTRGQINRAWLAEGVFGDPDLRARLNSIVHPEVAKLSRDRLAEVMGPTVPYVLYEAALLLETGRYEDFDALVIVDSSAEEQASRLSLRDTLSREQVEARIGAQYSREDKLAAADHVIHNHGTLLELREQVSMLHQILLQLSVQEERNGR